MAIIENMVLSFCIFLIFIWQFISSEFEKRTRETHKNHCWLLKSDARNHIATTYGLSMDSIQNNSLYFHVTEGLCPDIMHDILEGSLQYVLKELLNNFFQRNIISLQQVNSRIEYYPYSYTESKDKPVLLQSSNLDSSDHNIRQTGMLLLNLMFEIFYL